MLPKNWMFPVGFGLAIPLSMLSLLNLSAAVAKEATSPTSSSRAEVCNLVHSLPGAASTDKLLTTLKTDRQTILNDLQRMKKNMQQYDAEGYGWQNTIDGSGAIAPRPASWLIGALSMACESPTAASATVTGIVNYRQRIALPPTAKLIVKLEDTSRAGAPAIIIAEQTIVPAGKQVPIPFTLTYDPAKITPRGRYTVRAQIFDGDKLRWTSTQTNPVITDNYPTTNVTVDLQPVGGR